MECLRNAFRVLITSPKEKRQPRVLEDFFFSLLFLTKAVLFFFFCARSEFLSSASSLCSFFLQSILFELVLSQYYFYICLSLRPFLQNDKIAYNSFKDVTKWCREKQEQFQETLYFTVSPETLEKFRHLRPKKELGNTS